VLYSCTFLSMKTVNQNSIYKMDYLSSIPSYSLSLVQNSSAAHSLKEHESRDISYRGIGSVTDPQEMPVWLSCVLSPFITQYLIYKGTYMITDSLIHRVSSHHNRHIVLQSHVHREALIIASFIKSSS
jgi:hypothetical protein